MAGKGVFRPRGLTSAIVASERFRQFVEDHGLTNIQLVPIESYSDDRDGLLAHLPGPRPAAHNVSSTCTPPQGLRVEALHRLPFDKSAYKAQTKGADAAWIKQSRENWKNAWLVVVAYQGEAADVDFSCFNYGERPRDPNNQVAWLETVLDSRQGQTTAAFYLHYVESSGRLWYADQPITLPQPTAASRNVWALMPYQPPN